MIPVPSPARPLLAHSLTDLVTPTQLSTAYWLARKAAVDLDSFSLERFGVTPERLSIRGGSELLSALNALAPRRVA